MSRENIHYKYKGAETLVRLYEEQMLSFIDVWKTVKRTNLKLSSSSNLGYQLLNHLLHVV